jgi:hypothetical protein
MEMLIVTIVGILGFVMAFGLAFGALDLLFGVLAPMRLAAFVPDARGSQNPRLPQPLSRD